MRERRTLQLELLSYWHCGTGSGDGLRADAVPHRGVGGLPEIPGRTLKGLLRAAYGQAHDFGWVSQAPEALFGTALPDEEDRTQALEGEHRYRTEPGRLRVSSATLGPRWVAWATSQAAEAEELLRACWVPLASTALQDGVARDHTLRTLEVAVPMTLSATIEGESSDLSALTPCLPLLVALGSHRNRGLGRVRVRWNTQEGRG